MNCWDILGTEPTGDIAVIKRSYAQKLKLYHPEDDPQGFQRLREAYESALRKAEYIGKTASIVVDNELSQVGNDIFYEQLDMRITKLKSSFEIKTEINNVPENLANQFMDKVEEIYNNTILRNDLNKWEELLDDEVYWNLDVKQKLNYRMLNFLLERFQLDEISLPIAVWNLLNQHFFWTEQEKDLYNIFPETFLNFLMTKIFINRSVQREKSINETEAYPKYILYGNFVVIIVLGLLKAFLVSTQLGGEWSLSLALGMFFCGVFLGGFINNVVVKLLGKKGFFDYAAQHCPFCNKPTKFRIPLIWYYLKKKDCEHCDKRMIAHAFFTELLTGIIFFFASVGSPDSFIFSLKVLSFFCIMLLITIIDDVSQLILDKLSLLLAIIGIASNLLLGESNILEMIAGALMGGGSFLLLAIISKGRIGGGIIKLAAAIGVVLGWKLMIIAFSLVAVGMFITGIVMMNLKGWLVAGSGIISGSGLIFIGIIIGWKLAISIWGLFIIGMFITGINISLKARGGNFPVAPFFITATYITLLYKETLSKFFGL